MKSADPQPASTRTRREFLADSILTGGGLVLGLAFGERLRANVVAPGHALAADFAPDAFLRIGTDGSITLIAKHDEMGQGIHTGLAMAVCEELEVDVESVQVVPAPAHPSYAHSTFGVQVTGGSTSTWTSFEQMRRAGAVARAMLIAAAAKRWGIEATACEARNGTVRRRDGSASATYGELAAEAATVPVPENVALKDPSTFTRIGKPTNRVDSRAKVAGSAAFSLDRSVPGMLIAMVARSPYFGGKIRSFDAEAAKAMPGVKAVVRVPSGIAVIADSYWPAFKARQVLRIDWDPGPGGALDTAKLRADYRALAKKPGLVARRDGDPDGALEAAETALEAEYEVPFQAHAPMEPLSCLVTLRADGGADLITGSQMLGGDHPAVAARLGVDPAKVSITNSYLGGGFGRRANPASDFALEAVEVAVAGRSLGAPIKTVWSREDDIRGGWYRPMFVNALAAGITGGELATWRHRIVGQSIAAGTAFAPAMIHDGIDHTSVEGAADMPYAIPNLGVELHTVTLPVPVQWWRSVGHSNTAFAKECFLDECATAMGRDPYELRRELLAGHDRLLKVLDVAAEKAGWDKPAPAGVGRGIAVHESFKGFAAHVAEVTVEHGRPRVRRIVCAIDCGLIVNPDQVESQLQGAAIFALSAALNAQVTFEKGRVVQSNFHDFAIVRMHEAPVVEVYQVPNAGEMGGIGEVGVPSVAPAVCNAIYAACGKRVRRLPIGDQLA